MPEFVSLQCQKRLPTTSDSGITFLWLRHVHGLNLNYAIAETIRVLYLPLVLSLSSDAKDRVILERRESTKTFEKLMQPSRDGLLSISAPKRILVNIFLEFPTESDNGRCLAWLIKRCGEAKAIAKIIEAVQVLYAPTAVGAFGRGDAFFDEAVSFSRLIFSDLRASDAVIVTENFAETNGHLPIISISSSSTEPLPVLLSGDDEEDFDLDLDAIYEDD